MRDATSPGLSLRIADDSTYIIARTSGEHTVASALAAFPALLEPIEETGISKVLVDSREQQHMFDTLQALNFADQLERIVPARYQFAFVVQTPLKEAWFVETAMVNRRITAHYFNDYNQAAAWLGVANPTHQELLTPS
jgi:hypothetical protein